MSPLGGGVLALLLLLVMIVSAVRVCSSPREEVRRSRRRRRRGRRVEEAPKTPRERLEARLAPLHAERKARQRRIRVKLPPERRRDAPSATVPVPYKALWKRHGLAPPAVLRMAVTATILDRGRDLDSVASESSAWWLTRTGFPLGLPWSRVDAEVNGRCCRVCGRAPHSLGAFAAAEKTTVVLEGCDCGRGFGRWSVDSLGMTTWAVLSFEPGPRRGRCATALIAPAMPDDPLPPLALVLIDGRVAGMVAWVEDRLLFTNDLCSDPMLSDAAPVPLTDDEHAELERFLPRVAPKLLDAMNGTRADPLPCRTVWDLVGLESPRGEPGPEETTPEPLIAIDERDLEAPRAVTAA